MNGLTDTADERKEVQSACSPWTYGSGITGSGLTACGPGPHFMRDAGLSGPSAAAPARIL